MVYLYMLNYSSSFSVVYYKCHLCRILKKYGNNFCTDDLIKKYGFYEEYSCYLRLSYTQASKIFSSYTICMLYHWNQWHTSEK